MLHSDMNRILQYKSIGIKTYIIIVVALGFLLSESIYERVINVEAHHAERCRMANTTIILGSIIILRTK